MLNNKYANIIVDANEALFRATYNKMKALDYYNMSKEEAELSYALDYWAEHGTFNMFDVEDLNCEDMMYNAQEWAQDIINEK